MELNYLRYFYEVAKAGSFTEAARRLHISQSALSKSVAMLEDRESVKLFERSKKGVRLTEIGAEVYRKADTMFQTLSEIEAACRGQLERCEGPLRFGASDHIVNYVLLEQIKKMRAEHPDVTPSIFSGTPNDSVELILKDAIEFSLFFTKVNSPGIRYEALFPVEMALVCHPDLIPRDKHDLPASRLRPLLKKVGFIGSIRSQYQHHPSQTLIDILGEEPDFSFESNSQEAQKRICLSGGGIAYLAGFMVQAEIDAGRLLKIETSHAMSLPLLLARRRGRDLSLNARTFLAYIVNTQA